MRELRGIAIVLVVAVIVTGCSQALQQPMPAISDRLGLIVSKEPPSKWTDMPMGVHQIPDASVYVSGHQGAAGVGAAFGLIGLAIAHAAAQSTGERKTQSVQTLLKVDMPALTETALADELARSNHADRFVAGRPTGAALEIVPYLVLTFIGNDEARPWVVLKTALKDASGNERWKTRYSASLGTPRPLGGDRGWVADDGAAFRGAVDRSLRAALAVLLRDASGTLPRGRGRSVKVKGHWVWVKPMLEPSVEVLDETPETLIVAPKVPDGIVYAGISILDRRAVSVTPEGD